MLDVTLRSFEIIDQAPFKNGDRLLAYFGVELDGLSITGFQLVKTRKGGFRTVAPAIPDPTKRKARAISITDSIMQNALTQTARNAYIHLGGQFGDRILPSEFDVADIRDEHKMLVSEAGGAQEIN